MRAAKETAMKQAEAEVRKLDDALRPTHDQYDSGEISGTTYEASAARQSAKRAVGPEGAHRACG